jgi:signal transduction histidine kinase
MTLPTTPGPAEPVAPVASDASPAERAMLANFDAQRRLQLLRLVVPPLLGVAVLAMPFAIQADVGSGSIQSSFQDGIGLVAFAVAVWAIWQRRVDLASSALFAGVSGVIVFLLLSDGPLQGALDVSAIPAFALLTLPIAIAGLFGGPRWVALATGASALFTLLMILLTPHSPALARALATSDGLALFTIPLSTQIALGILMYAATRGFRRMQRELGDTRIAYAREKELDRLKDQFIDSVNHELRTPIMALQGYLALARELGKRGDTTRQQQMLHRGSEAAEHLAGLIQGALSVRQMERDATSINPRAFPLQPVIIGASHLLDPREAGAEARALHLHVPEDLCVYADKDRVRQVLLNLLSNAVKYSPAGSPIEVTARPAPPAVAPRGWRSNASPPAMVQIAVQDHGLGIPQDQAVLLFERFVRLERDIASPVGGAGLGLAICRSYVEAMGGRIWIESTGVPGEGTTFVFTLPLAQPSTEAVEAPERAPSQAAAVQTPSIPAAGSGE